MDAFHLAGRSAASKLPANLPLSPHARQLCERLLQLEPSARLGGGAAGAADIRSHPFFGWGGAEWEELLGKRMAAPLALCLAARPALEEAVGIPMAEVGRRLLEHKRGVSGVSSHRQL